MRAGGGRDIIAIPTVLGIGLDWIQSTSSVSILSVLYSSRYWKTNPALTNKKLNQRLFTTKDTCGEAGIEGDTDDKRVREEERIWEEE